MRKSVTISIADQALLSAATFAVNLALITLSEPAQFGRFVIGLSLLYIILSLQNALIVAPLSVFVPGTAKHRRLRLLRVFTSMDIVVVCGGAAAALAIGAILGFAGLELLALVAMIVFGLHRELARHVAIALGHITRFLIIDIVFIAVSAGAIAALWRVMAPEIACFTGIALGNAISACLIRVPLYRDFGRLRRRISEYRAYWPKTRWSLLGAGSTEAQTRLHVFLIEIFRNAAAVGTVQAGRVLISPVSLLAMAWGRVARPKLAGMLGVGRERQAFVLLHGGLRLIAFAAMCYFALLYFVWDIIENTVFQGRYPDIGWIVVAWCAYGAIEAPVRCLNNFYQAQQRFRELAIAGLCAAILASILLLSLMIPAIPVIAAVGCLLAGEIVMGLWLTAKLYITRPVEARTAEVTHG